MYRNATEYKLRLRGRTTRFSTESPTAHRWFYPRYAFGRLHERPATMRMIEDFQHAHCFADIGANLGYYTCLAGQFMRGGEIHAFEMDADNFALLQSSVALNDSTVDTHLNNVGISWRSGTIRYPRTPGDHNPGLSIYDPEPATTAEYVEVPAISIDEYFEERPVTPDLVKIDVEGAELDVLLGMTETLKSAQRMYIELHPPNLLSAGRTPAEVLATLADQFRIYHLPGHRSQKVESWREVTPTTSIVDNTMLLAIRR